MTSSLFGGSRGMTRVLGMLCLCAFAAGCGDDSSEDGEKSASADVAGLGDNTGVDGSITFEQASGGVRVSGSVTGLEPGSVHGFHLHVNGDCSSADGMSAGGHWNPSQTMHGAPSSATSHLGDLGNIEADSQGVAEVSITKAGMTLGDSAATDVIGRAVIVHAAPDDLMTDPTGNAGARIGCGVVR